MKNIIRKAGYVLCIFLGLSSCDVETSTVMFSDDNTLSTPNDTVFSVLGILAKVQNVADRGVVLGEVRGDLMSVKPEAQNDVMKGLAGFTNLTDTLFNRYRDYYAVINNCNFFLSRADTTMVRGNKQVFIKEYAVVSAWRAWTYLQLAKVYGTVPFYTKPLLSYSDIENTMADQSNRKGLQDICDYFITDLSSFVDTEYPYYGDFSYSSNATFDSKMFFLPVRLLLADLYLWRGSLAGDKNDFVKAAQLYHDYLQREGQTASSTLSSQYTSAEFSTWTSQWSSIFRSVRGGNERISIIPFAASSNYGTVFSLYENLSCMQGSRLLCNLVNEAPYCFTGYTSEQTERYAYVADSTFYGTKEKPEHLYAVTTSSKPQYTSGDLRLFAHSTSQDASISISKYSSSQPYVTTYRAADVWLRMAEAINRAGYPQTAFTLLKYGLSRGNLVKYDSDELPSLLNSGATFYDFGDNVTNLGFHSRGCGNAESDTLYVLGAGSTEERMAMVEDLLIDEYALETAFEGSRFFDLMRFAFRRGESFLAERVAMRDGILNEQLYQLLLDHKNWYLPMPEN
jgi:starch-binding outer membrane protein, SusD/RagB family